MTVIVISDKFRYNGQAATGAEVVEVAEGLSDVQAFELWKIFKIKEAAAQGVALTPADIDASYSVSTYEVRSSVSLVSSLLT